MKVKLIKKMEHRFIPSLSPNKRKDLKAGKTVDVPQEAADFLFEYQYATEVTQQKPKQFTIKPEANIDG